MRTQMIMHAIWGVNRPQDSQAKACATISLVRL